MSEKKIIVSNVAKEYSNPIAELVQVACQFDSEIRLENNEAKINAKSIMGIMAFNPSKGMTVNIVADGRRSFIGNGKIFSLSVKKIRRKPNYGNDEKKHENFN